MVNKKLIAGMSAFVLLATSIASVSAQTASEGTATVAVEGNGTLQVTTFDVDFGTIVAGSSDQYATGAIVGNEGHIVVNDSNGVSNWNVTIDIADLAAGDNSIADDNITMTSSTAVTTLAGNATDDITGITNSNVNFDGDTGYSIMSRTAFDGGEIGRYGVAPSFGLTIPAYQNLGSYQGAITVTLTEQ